MVGLCGNVTNMLEMLTDYCRISLQISRPIGFITFVVRERGSVYVSITVEAVLKSL